MKFQRKRCHMMSREAVGSPQNMVGPEFRKLHAALGKDVRPAFPHQRLNQRLRCVFALRKKTSIGRHPPILNFRQSTSAGCSCYSINFKYIIYIHLFLVEATVFFDELISFQTCNTLAAWMKKMSSIPNIHLLQKNINPCQLVCMCYFPNHSGGHSPSLRAKLFEDCRYCDGPVKYVKWLSSGVWCSCIWCRQGTLGGIKVLINMHG